MAFKADDAQTPESCACGHKHLTPDSLKLICEDAADVLMPAIQDAYHHSLTKKQAHLIAMFALHLGMKELRSMDTTEHIITNAYVEALARDGIILKRY